MHILAILIAFLSILNGLIMLAVPMAWYEMTPGVPETGPANVHFMRDIGLAFLAAGAATLWGARSQDWRFYAVAAIFVAGHGIFHLIELAAGHSLTGASSLALATEIFGVYLPSAGLIWLTWAARKAHLERRSHVALVPETHG